MPGKGGTLVTEEPFLEARAGRLVKGHLDAHARVEAIDTVIGSPVLRTSIGTAGTAYVHRSSKIASTRC
mgnify:CR=1 FL=1